MEKQPAQPAIDIQQVSFPNGNEATILTPAASVRTSSIIQALRLPRPGALILIAGGAAEMSKGNHDALSALFTDGVASLAASRNALIIDGGTQSGVMALMGKGVANRQYRSRLLGIAPAQNVIYPGKPTTSADLTPLDPNHSHFVLVDSDEWGGETETMYALAHHFSIRSPSVAVVVNGGQIAKKELLYNVRQRRPVIVIEGSGRLADEIARLWRERPSSFSDGESAEIIMQGNLHLFPLSGSLADFTSLLQSLLDHA